MSKFIKGVSGNPAGKKLGSINKRTQLAKLLEPHAEPLINKVIELALNGDSNALRLCLERLIPKAKDDGIKIILPNLDGLKPYEITQEIFKGIMGQEISIEQLKYILDILKYFGNPTDEAEDHAMVEKMTKQLDTLKKQYEREY